jgi:hypothetical protein
VESKGGQSFQTVGASSFIQQSTGIYARNATMNIMKSTGRATLLWIKDSRDLPDA